MSFNIKVRKKENTNDIENLILDLFNDSLVDQIGYELAIHPHCNFKKILLKIKFKESFGEDGKKQLVNFTFKKEIKPFLFEHLILINLNQKLIIFFIKYTNIEYILLYLKIFKNYIKYTKQIKDYYATIVQKWFIKMMYKPNSRYVKDKLEKEFNELKK